MKIGDADTVVTEPESIPTETTNADDSVYPRCDVCGQLNYEYVPGTRGRKPKYHEDCRPVSPSRTGTTPKRSSVMRNETALRDALTMRYHQIAMMANLVNPGYGANIVDKTDAAVEADLEYARVNPKFRRTLESMLEKSALGAVLAIHLSMVSPIVMGERARAARKRTGQSPPPSRGERGPVAPSTRPATAQPDLAPDNVTHMQFPEQSEPMPETVNAQDMPGMPGG